jgi:hypothetical protein
VAVTGLSGGGWQTITISSLDTRVKLTNPVAGYSSFRTRVDHAKDLGDSEQTPNDMATVADYTHLTAMMAPRATLLTYNSKDDCCFESGYALPPLIEAAAPFFRLYAKENALRSHVNDDPGTHNYEKDNRQAFYRMVGDLFYPGDQSFDAKEIPSEAEVKSKEELAVELPDHNANFQTLALALCKKLPRAISLPQERSFAEQWQQAQRSKLRAVVRGKDFDVEAEKANQEEKKGLTITYWRLRMGKDWTVPIVQLTPAATKATTVLLNDAGRRADPVNVERLLAAGHRVLAVDPFYFGESALKSHSYLYPLLIATVGERSLGIQASQVAAVARWSCAEHKNEPVDIVAVGPRMSTIALVAAGLEAEAIGRLELQGSLGSLKEIVEQNRSFEQIPEVFCFGLLEAFDIKQLTALAAPRPVTFVQASARAKAELSDLKAWYGILGVDFQPLR